MNNNFEALVRLLVPLSFMAIWALTSLFNRESKSSPARPSLNRRPSPNPQRTEPTLRFGSQSPAALKSEAEIRAKRAAQTSRPAVTSDGIVVLSSSEDRRGKRNSGQAPSSSKSNRSGRSSNIRPLEAPQKQTKLAGVSQNVSQHSINTNLNVPLLLSPDQPLLGAPSTATQSSPRGSSDDASSPRRDGVMASLMDPARLREAFLINEILRPPVALRHQKRRKI